MRYITLQEILSYVDEVKKNDFSRRVMLIWLNEIEYRVQTDIMLFAAETVESVPDDDTHYLKVPAPWYELYYDYLLMKISEHLEESSQQNNRAATFDKTYTRFARWWADTYNPGNGNAVFKGYYVQGPAGEDGKDGKDGFELPPQVTLEEVTYLSGVTENIQEQLDDMQTQLDGKLSNEDGSVTTAKIESDAVTAAKIANGAVTADKLAAGAVSEEKIAAKAISKAKLGDDVLTVEHGTIGSWHYKKWSDGNLEARASLTLSNVNVSNSSGNGYTNSSAPQSVDISALGFTEISFCAVSGGTYGGGAWATSKACNTQTATINVNSFAALTGANVYVAVLISGKWK